jgi:hypothetical protein
VPPLSLLVVLDYSRSSFFVGGGGGVAALILINSGHKDPRFVPILSQINPVSNLLSYLLRSDLILSSFVLIQAIAFLHAVAEAVRMKHTHTHTHTHTHSSLFLFLLLYFTENGGISGLVLSLLSDYKAARCQCPEDHSLKVLKRHLIATVIDYPLCIYDEYRYIWGGISFFPDYVWIYVAVFCVTAELYVRCGVVL